MATLGAQKLLMTSFSHLLPVGYPHVPLFRISFQNVFLASDINFNSLIAQLDSVIEQILFKVNRVAVVVGENFRNQLGHFRAFLRLRHIFLPTFIVLLSLRSLVAVFAKHVFAPVSNAVDKTTSICPRRDSAWYLLFLVPLGINFDLVLTKTQQRFAWLRLFYPIDLYLSNLLTDKASELFVLQPMFFSFLCGTFWGDLTDQLRTIINA